MADNTSSFKQVQSFKFLLQQMAKAPLSTRLQNNWSGSRQDKESVLNGTIIQHGD